MPYDFTRYGSSSSVTKFDFTRPGPGAALEQPAPEEQEKKTAVRKKPETPKVEVPPGVNPEFAAKHPTFTRVMNFLTAPLRRFQQTEVGKVLTRGGEIAADTLLMTPREAYGVKPTEPETTAGKVASEILGMTGMVAPFGAAESAVSALARAAARAVPGAARVVERLPEAVQTLGHGAATGTAYWGMEQAVMPEGYKPGIESLPATAATFGGGEVASRLAGEALRRLLPQAPSVLEHAARGAAFGAGGAVASLPFTPSDRRPTAGQVAEEAGKLAVLGGLMSVLTGGRAAVRPPEQPETAPAGISPQETWEAVNEAYRQARREPFDFSQASTPGTAEPEAVTSTPAETAAGTGTAKRKPRIPDKETMRIWRGLIEVMGPEGARPHIESGYVELGWKPARAAELAEKFITANYRPETRKTVPKQSEAISGEETRPQAPAIKEPEAKSEQPEKIAESFLAREEVKPVAPSEKPAKEPWQMTKEEFEANQPAGERNRWIEARLKEQGISTHPTSTRGKLKFQEAARRAAEEFDREFANRHRRIVKQALSEGKPVPLEVLKDYPDLAEEAGARPPETTAEAEEEATPGKTEPWLTDEPFTRQDIDRYNRFTHFETTVEDQNRRFAEDSRKEEEYARERLKKYGISEIPDDVRQALERLRRTRYELFLARIRGREIAPPVSVVGPARYSEHARPEKAEAIVRRAMENYEVAKKNLDVALKRYSPNAPISSDDPEAVKKLRDKLAKLEQQRELMKEANKIVRDKHLTDQEKIAKLEEIGLSAWAGKILKPDFMGRTGFQDYHFHNIGQEIRRLKERIAELEKRVTEETGEIPFEGGRIVDNVDANRVQIFFDEKPDENLRAELKRHGFRWAPSAGAWQRQRSEQALYWARRIVGLPEKTAEKVEPEKTSETAPVTTQKYKLIGFAGPGKKGKLYPTLEEALEAEGPRNVYPVIEKTPSFWDDPDTVDSYGEPFGPGIAVRPGWAKRVGLITPEQFALIRGKKTSTGEGAAGSQAASKAEISGTTEAKGVTEEVKTSASREQRIKEIIDQLDRFKGDRYDPERVKLLQELGFLSTGVRLTDAEETGLMRYMLEKGEITREDWDRWVQDLIDSNKIKDKSILAETPGKTGTPEDVSLEKIEGFASSFSGDTVRIQPEDVLPPGWIREIERLGKESASIDEEIRKQRKRRESKDKRAKLAGLAESKRENTAALEKYAAAVREKIYGSLASDTRFSPVQREMFRSIAEGRWDQAEKDRYKNRLAREVYDTAVEKGLPEEAAKSLASRLPDRLVNLPTGLAELAGGREIEIKPLETAIAEYLRSDRKIIFGDVLASVAKEKLKNLPEEERKKAVRTLWELATDDFRGVRPEPGETINDYVNRAVDLDRAVENVKKQEARLREGTGTVDDLKKAVSDLAARANIRRAFTGEALPYDLPAYLRELDRYEQYKKEAAKAAERAENAISLQGYVPLKKPLNAQRVLGKPEAGSVVYYGKLDGVDYVSDRYVILPVSEKELSKVKEAAEKAGSKFIDVTGHMKKLFDDAASGADLPLGEPVGLDVRKEGNVVFFKPEGGAGFYPIKNRYYEYARRKGWILKASRTDNKSPVVAFDRNGRPVAAFMPIRLPEDKEIFLPGETPPAPEKVDVPSLENYRTGTSAETADEAHIKVLRPEDGPDVKHPAKPLDQSRDLLKEHVEEREKVTVPKELMREKYRGLYIAANVFDFFRRGEIRSDNPRVERVLRQWGLPRFFHEQVVSRFNGLAEKVRDIFLYEWTVRDFPQLVEQLRRFQGVTRDAEVWALRSVKNVLRHLENPRDYETFRRMAVLRDLKASLENGEKVPGDLTLQEVEDAIRELQSKVNSNVQRALGEHDSLMKAVWAELQNRGKVSPLKEGREHYYPHRVLDYLANFDRRFPAVARRLKEPNRYYLKERRGTTRYIDTDYIGVMLHDLTKIYIDNATDDFMAEVAAKYDIWPGLDKKTREKLGEPVPGRLYDIDGKRYMGWQYDPGRQIYPATSVYEEQALKAVEEIVRNKLGPADAIAKMEELFRKVPALGRYKRVYLLPEEIALRLTRLREPRITHHWMQAITGAVNWWKGAVLGPLGAGIPFQTFNFIGDCINLFREDPVALLYLAQGWKAAGQWQKNIVGPKFKRMVEVAELGRVLEAGMMKRGGLPYDPVLARLEPQRYWLRKVNPGELYSELSERRELTPRLAKLIVDLKRIDAGKLPVAKSIDVKKLIRDGLTPEEVATKIAREALVDYGKLTPEMKEYRDLFFPFLTFYVQNFENWVRYIARNPGDFIIKFFVPLAAISLYNWTVHGDVEESLPVYYRIMPHLITGYRTEDGKPIIIGFQTPIDQAAEVLGLEIVPDLVRRVNSGEITLGEAAKELAGHVLGSVPREMWSLFNPFFKAPIEAAMNRDTFRDRPIVPERLKGTPEDMQLRLKYILQQWFAPYAQYMRAIRSPEKAALWPFKGSWNVQRALGIREVDVQGETVNRFYDLLEEQEGKYRHMKALMERGERPGREDKPDASLLAVARRAERQISDLQKRIRKIDASSLDPDERSRRIAMLKERQARIAERVLRLADRKKAAGEGGY